MFKGIRSLSGHLRAFSTMKPAVRIVEVGPRDGLQNISKQISTEVKVDLIQKLYETGLRTIEVTSVVSPQAVPQLKDCRDVLKSPTIQRLLSDKAVRAPVLIPNVKGANIASEYGISEVAVFVSATEGFSKANIRCTVDEGLERAALVAQTAQDRGWQVRGYISCIFADPFDGPTPHSAVLNAVQKLQSMGCYEISLGDTLGVGTPAQVRQLLKYLNDNGIPLDCLAGHFHDTYGQAIANIWEAYNCGLRVFDSSVAGLGGCPFAPGAKGNVATEDLVYMFDQAGVSTGVDLPKLVEVGSWISNALSMPTSSRAGAALVAKAQRKQAGVGKPAPATSKIPVEWKVVRNTDELQISRFGANLKITMNRPRNGNALTATMIEDLISIFNGSAADSSINRVILTGEGKFFCTGMDLGKSSTRVGSDDSGSNAQFNLLTRLFETIDNFPKVTIAALNGPAFGGGVGLALTCDLRICAKNAHLTLSEAKLGLCPATISKYVVRELGIPLSREAMLSARPLSPTELKEKSIVMDIAEDSSKLQELLDSLVVRLRVASTDASIMCKDLVRAGWAHGGQQDQAVAIEKAFKDMMRPGAAGDYGVKEFQAGRKVDWDEYNNGPLRSKL